MAQQVFISYSHKDHIVADALCHRLEEDKIKCWYAPRDIRPGESWAGEIAESIQRSDVMVLIFSSNSNKSKQVLREVELAINNNVVLIPLRIENVIPTGSMSYFLSTTHWIDAIGEEIENNFAIISGRIASLFNIDIKKDEKVKTDIPDHLEKLPLQTKKPVKTRRSKRGLIKFMAGIAAVAVIATAAVLLPKYLISEIGVSTVETGSKIYTPEDFKLEPETLVTVEDEVLKQTILQTLDDIGKPVEGELTVADMFNLEYLMVSSSLAIESTREVTGDSEIFNSLIEGIITIENSIESLSGIQYARNLKKLIVMGQSIRDISPLANLTALNIVYLNDNKITDISALNGLTDLKWLQLNYNIISDISALEGLTGLEDLLLYYNKLVDISALGKLTKLINLSLGNNSISDISVLGKLNNLDNVNIQNNNLSDLGVLKEMGYLNGINLAENNIDDIGVLASLRKAKWLILNGNNISDISPIADLRYLEFLSLKNNDINDISALEGMGNLKNLSIDLDTFNKNPEIVSKLLERECIINTD